MKTKSLSIAIIAHNSYGVMAGKDIGHVGGIEIQMPMMAKFLNRHGHDVTLITWDEDYEDGIEIEGVSLRKMCHKEAGLPGLRFFWPRWSGLLGALSRTDPDVIFYNTGDLILGQVVLWAQAKSRKVVFSVSNDINCQASLPGLNSIRERTLYRYGLNNADHIIAQTKTQQKLLQVELGLQSEVILMPCEGFIGDAKRPEQNSRNKVLWIGRLATEKRCEWLLDVAESTPHIDFDIIGAPNYGSVYAKSLMSRAETIKNVRLVGRVSHGDMVQHLCNASLLCCTSIYEGFPNTFLEAFSVGLPIVSTFDPDGIIEHYKLGAVANTKDEIISGLQKMLSDENAWTDASNAALAYFRNNHDYEQQLEKFENALIRLFD